MKSALFLSLDVRCRCRRRRRRTCEQIGVARENRGSWRDSSTRRRTTAARIVRGLSARVFYRPPFLGGESNPESSRAGARGTGFYLSLRPTSGSSSESPTSPTYRAGAFA